MDLSAGTCVPRALQNRARLPGQRSQCGRSSVERYASAASFAACQFVSSDPKFAAL
jgi:hypothetical protein